MVSRENKLTRLVLKKLGIDWEKSNYKEFHLIEYGEDKRPNISKLLKICGGKPKECNLGDFETRGSGSGQPEIIVEIKNKKVILIVECKSDKDKHQTTKLNRPASHNLDGVLYYAKYFKESCTVLFLAVTGDAEKEEEWLISFGIWKQGLKAYKEVVNKITTKSSKEEKILPWQKYFQRLEENTDIRKVAKDLHNRLRVIKVGNKNKPLFIGACLLALRDDDFYKKVSENNFDKEEDIPTLLKNALNSASALGRKKNYDSLNKKLQEVIEGNKNLLIKQEKKEHRLSSILKKIQTDVYPLLKTSQTDIIGEFYHEFLRYTGSDGKGLGIVLTPSHIAELFCDLVKLEPTSKVLDICCGTGTFLVVALSRMEKKGDIKKSLYGIESDEDIYYLLWINMILHGDGSSNIHHTSCFDKGKNFEEEKIEPLLETEKNFTVGFLNPPYSQQDYNEAEFILHLLKFLRKGGKAVIITDLKIARGTKMKKERKELLEQHTLKAVMTMPNDLFYGNKSGVSTCVMVWVAHEPHHGKTWLASWKDDGFIVKDGSRKEKIEGVSWKETKKEWLENYFNQEEDTYVSKLELIELKPNEKQHKQSWLPEFYLPVDYSQVKEKHFVESLRDYLGYIMAISVFPSQLSSFSELDSKIIDKLSLSLKIDEWEYFPITNLFTSEEANQTNFRVNDGKKVRESEEDIPLISTSKRNNGCVGYVKMAEEENITKGNCISFSSFGGFFYQPIDFYRSYARDGNVWYLRADWLNEKRGLFMGALLTNVYAEKFHYGWQVNGKNIYDLKVKLPVIQDGEKKGQPDWDFMENYIKQVISSLSLSLSLEIQFLQRLI